MTHICQKMRPLAVFGQRKMALRICIVESKAHIRTFLREELEETGFVIHESAAIEQLEAMLMTTALDVVLLTLSSGADEAVKALAAVARSCPSAAILLIGPHVPALDAVKDRGLEAGLRMLEPLITPYRIEGLRQRLQEFAPAEDLPSLAADVEEALRCGWLQLWYEPKVDVRTLKLCGAEAVTRLCHPNWGTVSPTKFLAGAGDPHFRTLTDFVVMQAIADWGYFLENYSPVDMAVSLPMPFLENSAAVALLRDLMPDHPAFNGMLIQVKGADVARSMGAAKRVAKQLRLYNIAISIDDFGDEWSTFTDFTDFPFVEVKVDARFISGCADDRLKQCACRTMLDVADRFGARVVAKGIETKSDLLMAQEMGFHFVQGRLFAPPMKSRKFARKMLADARQWALRK